LIRERGWSLSALWSFLSPFAARAVQWLAWAFILVTNASLTVFESHKTETVLAVLVVLALFAAKGAFGFAVVAALALAAGYAGFKAGRNE